MMNLLLRNCHIVVTHGEFQYINVYFQYLLFYCVAWWLSGRALDLRFTGRGFNSRPVAFT